MRIACVHIPQFALQCATRIDPSLRRAESPVVVVGPAAVIEPRGVAPIAAPSRAAAPVVLACSRAAWALGVRVGMMATAARGLSPQLEIVTADAQLERDTVRAIADVLLGASPVVDIGGRVVPGGAHLALYCEVPAKTRGTSFGDRLLQRLETLGLTGRIGIADDRFTAWVAASAPPAARSDARDRDRASATAATRHDDTGVVSVPRGGSAAFLAPRPLSLLAISPEVQHMLEALGVCTLGEFAALPSPTVSSRGARFEADYQALARGESGNVLRPYAPDAPIREDAVLHGDGHVHGHEHGPGLPHAGTGTHAHDLHDHGLSAPAAVALLAERVALRLAGRARCAARLDITLAGEAGERVVTLAPVRDGQGVLSTAEQLADAIGAALGPDSAQLWRLRVVVTGEALAGDVPDADDAFELPAQRAFAVAAPAATSEVAMSATAGMSAVATSTTAAISTTATTASTAMAAASTPRASRAAARARSSAPDYGAARSAAPASAPPGALADPDLALSIALSTTGGAVERVFGLTSPVASSFAMERRDAHRRTRRGKQRRRTPVQDTLVQPRLFKM